MIVTKLTNMSSKKKTNVLNSVNLTDWLMICFACYVMQIALEKTKANYTKKPPIYFTPLHDLETKPSTLFYIVTKFIRLSRQIVRKSY